jgi:hypothetical protein
MRSPFRIQQFRTVPLMAATLALVFFTGIAGRIADLTVAPVWPRAAENVESVAGSIQDRVEPAIFLGGIVIDRSRHIIAGGVMGCIAGAGIGATATAAVGLVTGGVALAALPAASAAGCGIGGLGGAAFGYPLDAYSWDWD